MTLLGRYAFYPQPFYHGSKGLYIHLLPRFIAACPIQYVSFASLGFRTILKKMGIMGSIRLMYMIILLAAASAISTCERRPKFILCSGGSSPWGYNPTYSGQNTTSNGVNAENLWSHLSSWIPQRNASPQSTEDSRYPGRGRTLGAGRSDSLATSDCNDSNLQSRLLDDTSADPRFDVAAANAGDQREPSGNMLWSTLESPPQIRVWLLLLRRYRN